jgi:hypothetical protein
LPAQGLSGRSHGHSGHRRLSAALSQHRTDRDIVDIQLRADELAEIVGDPLAPPIRHAREQHELDRLRAIIDDHQRGVQQ